MKIVKFKDGTYAIRKGWRFNYQYKDLNGKYWWSKNERDFFPMCKGNREDIEMLYLQLTDVGEVVND